MDSGSSRWKKVAVAVVILAVGLVTFHHVRWFVFESRIHNALLALDKQPTSARIIALKPAIAGEGRSLLMSSSSLQVDVELVQHSSQGLAFKEDMSEAWWFVVVDARLGSKQAKWEQRIDNTVALTDREKLEAAGVRVRPAQPAATK